MSSNPTMPPPRASKRYPYEVMVQITLEDELDEGKIVNISASGIQFLTRHAIRTDKPIRLFWNDSGFGAFDPKVYVVRTTQEPEDAEFKFIYGAQYYQLDEEIKPRLLELLRSLKSKEQKESQEKVQLVSAEFLLKACEDGASFLPKLLSKAIETPPILMHVLGQIAEYEKRSFVINNEIAKFIQKLAVQTFQCNILITLIATVAKKPDLKIEYFRMLVWVMKDIRQLNKQMKAIVKEIGSLQGPEQNKEMLRQRVQESSNRVFYVKQALLESVLRNFEKTDSRIPQFVDSFKIVTSEYEETLEVSKSSAFDLSRWKKPKKGGYEKSIAETIVDLQKAPDPFASPTLNLVLLFLVVVLLLIVVFQNLIL